MATNLVDGQAIDPMTITAPAAVTAGQLVDVGGIVGVALASAASAASVAIATRGTWNLTHGITNTAFAIGDIAYYDTTNNVVASTTTWPRLGVYTAAKVTTSTVVQIRLNGSF
jgi:predicted RecA/RadA family phage recombinase